MKLYLRLQLIILLHNSGCVFVYKTLIKLRHKDHSILILLLVKKFNINKFKLTILIHVFTSFVSESIFKPVLIIC